MKDKKIEQDEILGVETKVFHYSKSIIGLIVKPLMPKIQKGTDSVYDKTKSVNAKLFKEIIAELEEKDKDVGGSTGSIAGYTRKQFYILIAKFFVCLYEYDIFYSERIDFVIARLFEQGDRIYLDEQRNPLNWYPNRNTQLLTVHVLRRNGDIEID